MTRGVGGQSPSNIAQHLKGMDFPAEKDDILECAKQNRADQEVMEALEHIPDQEYENMAEVMKGIGEGE